MYSVLSYLNTYYVPNPLVWLRASIEVGSGEYTSLADGGSCYQARHIKGIFGSAPAPRAFRLKNACAKSLLAGGLWDRCPPFCGFTAMSLDLVLSPACRHYYWAFQIVYIKTCLKLLFYGKFCSFETHRNCTEILSVCRKWMKFICRTGKYCETESL